MSREAEALSLEINNCLTEGGGMTVTAIYTIQAATDNADELFGLLRQGRDFALTVEGSEGFEIFQGKDEPDRFVMVEHWGSVEAHQSHFEQNVKSTGVLDSAEALMTEPFPPPTYYVSR